MSQQHTSNKIPYKNRSNKLTSEMIDTVCKLYEEGWRVTWISNKFKLDHTSIIYYVKKYNLKKKKVISNIDALQIRQSYGYRSKYPSTLKNMSHTIYKTYAEHVHDATRKAATTLHDTECSHQFWIKRCSLCSAILESDTRVNKTADCTQKDIYNNFDKIVCSYQTAKKLAALNVTQHVSVLFWVYYIKMNVLQIKSKQNLPNKHDTDTSVVAAFTTQELCKKILNISSMHNDVSLAQLAKISNKPNALAALLIALLVKQKKERLQSQT